MEGTAIQLGSLFVRIGFVAEQDKLVKFNSSVTALSTSFMAVRQVIEDAYASMVKFMQSSIDTAKQLGRLNKEFGLDTGGTQKWQIAYQLANIGLSAQDAISDIDAFQKRLEDVTYNESNAKGFNFFGFSAYETKDALAAFDKISSRIREWKNNGQWTPKQQLATQAMLDNFGLRGRRTVFEQTNNQRDKQSKGLVLTDKEIGNLNKAGLAFTRLQLGVSKTINSIMAVLAPGLSNILNMITNNLTKLQSFVFSFANQVGSSFSGFGDRYSEDIKTLGINLSMAFSSIVKFVGELEKIGVLKVIINLLSIFTGVLSKLFDSLTFIIDFLYNKIKLILDAKKALDFKEKPTTLQFSPYGIIQPNEGQNSTIKHIINPKNDFESSFQKDFYKNRTRDLGNNVNNNGDSNKVNNINTTFNIQGDNPKLIGDLVIDRYKKSLNDGLYQGRVHV